MSHPQLRIRFFKVEQTFQIHGIAFVGFSNEEDRKAALRKNKSFMGDKQAIFIVFLRDKVLVFDWGRCLGLDEDLAVSTEAGLIKSFHCSIATLKFDHSSSS